MLKLQNTKTPHLSCVSVVKSCFTEISNSLSKEAAVGEKLSSGQWRSEMTLPRLQLCTLRLQEPILPGVSEGVENEANERALASPTEGIVQKQHRH